MAFLMEPHYEKRYFFAEKYGPKKYMRADGSMGEFGYTQGGLWNFQGILNKLIELLGAPRSVLDVGCGCGGFPATLRDNYIEALGLEFSQYAIDNAIMGAKPLLVKWDLSETPWPVEKQYDWVTMIDLMEHIFEVDADKVISEAKRVARRWIVAKVCTAQLPHEVWAAKRASYEEVYAQARAEGYEWLVVSGHVNSQWPKYWINKFVDDDWKNREDLSERFKKDLKLPEDWRTTLILEDTKFFEKEFGR